MDEKELKRQYYKDYYHKNKDKYKEYQARCWKKKLEKHVEKQEHAPSDQE